jgi:hypothetical protein
VHRTTNAKRVLAYEFQMCRGDKSSLSVGVFRCGTDSTTLELLVIVEHSFAARMQRVVVCASWVLCAFAG